MNEKFLHTIFPNEILLLIFHYLTSKDIMFLTKTNYEIYHTNIIDYYPKLKTKQGFTNYCKMLAKNNCFYIISLLIHNNYLLLYNPRQNIRIYYRDNVFWSYLTYMKFLVKNKNNKTYYLLQDTINAQQLKIGNNDNNRNENNENNRNKKSNREKKNFKTKKYVREWGN